MAALALLAVEVEEVTMGCSRAASQATMAVAMQAWWVICLLVLSSGRQGTVLFVER
jgi:hypothetical protein